MGPATGRRMIQSRPWSKEQRLSQAINKTLCSVNNPSVTQDTEDVQLLHFSLSFQRHDILIGGKASGGRFKFS